MTTARKISRRRLLSQSLAATTAGIALPALLSSCNGSYISPNSQINIGIIGCGRRNGQLVIGKGGQGKPPEYARIVAGADFNGARADQWAKNYGSDSYQEYGYLLDRKDIDVIIYATPEHQHYLPCIHACQAGKDMYGEQPLTHAIREGEAMIAAVRKYNRIFQTGEMQRSNPKTRMAVELIRNGRIGKIQKIIGYNYPSPYECTFPAQPIPPDLDWDRWCGPNPLVPYNTDLYLSRIPYEREPPYPVTPAEHSPVGPGWMSFRPYSGGELANWGCHGLSMVHWALDMDRSGPKKIWVEPAEKMEHIEYSTPELRWRGDSACSRTIIHYKYANDGNKPWIPDDGVELELSSMNPKIGGGAIFMGEKGKITIFRGGYECDPVGLDKEPLPANAIRVYESNDHMVNFFTCVQTRQDPIMCIEAGDSVATLCHLGNIARWLGRGKDNPLKWDAIKREFPGDEEANNLRDVERRKGYEVPTQV